MPWTSVTLMDFRIFAAKIVHAELKAAGYKPPSLRTVARWTSSGKAPGWAEQAMRDLLGMQTETAPPDWAERLLVGVMALETKAGISEEERVKAEALASAWAAFAEAQRRPRRGAGVAPGRADA